MIFDKLENAEFYYAISPKMKTAFEFIKNTDWKSLKAGRYVLNDDIFANLEEYTTKDECEAEFEVHRKYYDIQYVIEGAENMGFGQLEDFVVSKEYNGEKDVAFGDCPHSTVLVKEGFFTFFAPNDAHKPCLKTDGGRANVKKVIIKIKI